MTKSIEPINEKYLNELRALINPAYVNVIGTESYERNILISEIDRLRKLIENLSDGPLNLIDICGRDDVPR